MLWINLGSKIKCLFSPLVLCWSTRVAAAVLFFFFCFSFTVCVWNWQQNATCPWPALTRTWTNDRTSCWASSRASTIKRECLCVSTLSIYVRVCMYLRWLQGMQWDYNVLFILNTHIHTYTYIVIQSLDRDMLLTTLSLCYALMDFWINSLCLLNGWYYVLLLFRRSCSENILTHENYTLRTV